MDKQTRRDRLRQALTGRSIKPADKSYVSQLLSGTASFGEKAARRLEVDYLLPPMSLDQPLDQQPIADCETKKELIKRISQRLEHIHIEKVKALAIILEA
ncbi:hypothetical protein PO883_31705 [Massilia sp. DJPM01]|uniref:hypothetical protein n=1 Tax=Massilia sp. DJPM01 TaxID=3024404 RepID=UPI00259E37E7|nr:hypothetical protein [Massilia sp. DJPM01]MDM5181748.1 hypothetical protein [Massilia sp. DJPM01]